MNGFVTQIQRTVAGGLGNDAAALGTFTPYGPELLGTGNLFGGVTATYTYDERRRISEMDYVKGTSIERIKYRYDTRNRRGLELLEVAPVQSRYHSFDDRSRLVGTDQNTGVLVLPTAGYTQANHDADVTAGAAAINPAPLSYGFTVNKSDSRTLYTETGLGNQTYTYNNGHQLTNAGTEAVTHHTDGERKTDAANSYEVDAFGRILTIKDVPGTTTKYSFAYDALGRVSTIDPQTGTVRKFNYFDSELWQEMDNSTIVRQISRHPSMPESLAIHENSPASYLTLYDARLNLLSLTDSTGTQQDQYRYTPFGVPTPATPTNTGQEPKFGGTRYLNNAGLYAGGARLMDPVHGKWLSHDPLGYIDSSDLYSYAVGNPIDFVDPFGLSALKFQDSSDSDGYLPTLRDKTSVNYDWTKLSDDHSDYWDRFPLENKEIPQWLKDYWKTYKQTNPVGAYGAEFAGNAAGGMLIGGLELANDPVQRAIIDPAKGLVMMGATWTPANRVGGIPIYSWEQQQMQSAMLAEMGEMVQDPAKGGFATGRGLAHNAPAMLATRGTSAMFSRGMQSLSKYANFSGSPRKLRFTAYAESKLSKEVTGFLADAAKEGDSFIARGSIRLNNGVPFDMKLGAYMSESSFNRQTFRFGTFPAGGGGPSFGRRALQIKPDYQRQLGPWQVHKIPAGTPFEVGIVGPQAGQPVGTWIQFYKPDGFKFNPE